MWRSVFLAPSCRETRELSRSFVAVNIYDTTLVIVRAIMSALAFGFIAAVIAGGSAPNATVAIVVFVLAGAVPLLCWASGWHGRVSRPAD